MHTHSLPLLAIGFLIALNSIECHDLNDMFDVAHAENQALHTSLNNRAKRNIQQESQDSHAYSYHPHSASLMSGVEKLNDDQIRINKYASTGLRVSMKLLSNNFKNLQATKNPLQVLKTMQAPSKFCPFKTSPTCDPNFPYRTLDGSCNNMNQTWWGMAGTPFKRWTPADYSDQFKLNEPRASKDGSPLPNPRLLACALNPDKHEIEAHVTHLFMQWGQLINHDITSLSITREDDPDQSICKTCTATHKCLPIMITSNVTCNCVKTMKHDCIEFTRSSASFGDVACTLGPREQVNMQTAFLDASHIYGAGTLENQKLRQSTGGLMRVQTNNPTNPNQDLLPASTQERPSDCLDFRPETKCFVAGDDRINQNPGLMSMQTIFVREHNRIARELARANPTWQDELLFHEARRVVIAQIQHITYNEYLPELLGSETIKLFQLGVGQGSEKLNIYSPTMDPRISNEYAASAGRFGHSMVRTDYSRLDSGYKSSAKSFALRNSYFRANDLYDWMDGGLESIVRGMLVDPLMAVDRWFTTELTQHLFETKNSLKQPFHFDLVSININRGRDHGIQGYTAFRDFCGLAPINTWQDMSKFQDPEVVDLYKSFYRSPQDVDLFLAAVSETRIDEEGLVGPTLKCLLGLQYQSIKFGDRFWYETAQSPGDFTFGQLGEIRKSSLAKVLCRNMNDTPRIQPLALVSAKKEGNLMVDCGQLERMSWLPHR
jgi:peroxidase